MQRWSALVEIVKSFNERGSPRLAFASVALFLLVPLALLVIICEMQVHSNGAQFVNVKNSERERYNGNDSRN